MMNPAPVHIYSVVQGGGQGGGEEGAGGPRRQDQGGDGREREEIKTGNIY